MAIVVPSAFPNNDLLLDVPTVPTVIAVLLLDDDHVPRIRRGARHNRQGKAERGDGSKSKYDLSHASYLLWSERHSNARGGTAFQFIF
jgi:hypothetical protein